MPRIIQQNFGGISGDTKIEIYDEVNNCLKTTNVCNLVDCNFTLINVEQKITFSGFKFSGKGKIYSVLFYNGFEIKCSNKCQFFVIDKFDNSDTGWYSIEDIDLDNHSVYMGQDKEKYPKIKSITLIENNGEIYNCIDNEFFIINELFIRCIN